MIQSARFRATALLRGSSGLYKDMPLSVLNLVRRAA
jgi:hypothetical protein